MRDMRYADALHAALLDEMRRDDSVVVFGEDVGVYGGVFKVTRGLQAEFGDSRVRDTPIAEQAIAGMAIGAAMVGLKPVAEIMYVDFLPLTLDQLINQASIMHYVWAGQVTLPFVLRTQGGAGTGGGAQHSKSLEAIVAHVPGLKVVMPATPADAKGLLTAAIRDPNPVIFIEHKALYNTRGPVPDGEHVVPIGPAAIARPGTDATIVANSRMVLESLEAAGELAAEGISAEVIDARTPRPLDTATILASVQKTNRAVVVNEGWRTGGLGAEISALIAEEAFDFLDAPVARLGGLDRPIPYSEPLEAEVLPDAARIAAAVRKLL
ncbi:MAG: alpha-ketoacid dehydrogenase subunit beta [Rhodospirillales bacterium]|jgi:pyruvate dehydrogenase E1 component beta subunit|nr:alpha-ketoacid dehydrogenase subunit beta [Rhodospirillales bacterium]